MGTIGMVALYAALSGAPVIAQSSDGQPAPAAAAPAIDPATLPFAGVPYALPADGVLRSFDSALSDLAIQGQVGILTEDVPLHTRLSDVDLGNLKMSLGSSTPLTVAAALDAVAKAYDYEVQPEPKGDGLTVVLVKRYSDPNDLPFVTFDEAFYSLRTLTRGLDGFNPHIPDSGPDYPPFKLLTSLDADDYKAASSASGLPYTSLNAQQKEWVRDSISDAYVGSALNALDKICDMLRETRGARSTYRWMNLMRTGTQVFGMQLPWGQNGDLLQCGLSHGFMPQFIGGVNTNTITHIVSSYIVEVPTERGQHDLNEADEAQTESFRLDLEKFMNGKPLPDPFAPKPGEREPTSNAEITLGKAVTSLAEPAAPTTVSGAGVKVIDLADATIPAGQATAVPKYFVNPVVADKVVCIFDPLKRLTPPATMQALAAVYGLNLLHQQDGSDELTLPAMPPVNDISDVASAMRSVLPAPWMRFYSGSMQREEATATQELLKHYARRSARIKQFVADVAAAESVPKADAARFQPIAHRLRVVVEPLVAKSPSRQIPMAAAGAEADRLLALLFVNDKIEDVDPIINPTSFGVARFLPLLEDLDNCTVTGNLNHKEHGMTFDVSYPDKDGVLREVFYSTATIE
jgi:hypothetical protein